MYSKPSNKKIKISFLILVSLILLSIIFLVNSYSNVQSRINKSGEDYLTKTNEYAINILEKSIDKYKILIQEQRDEIVYLLKSNVDTDQEIYSLINTPNSEAVGIYLVNVNNDIISSYRFNKSKNESSKMDDNYLKTDQSLNGVEKNKNVDNGKEFFLNGRYYINIYVYDEKSKCTIIAPIDLQKIFKNNLQNEETMYSGYTMVKNENLEVIMHPSDNQIGLNIVEDRKKVYPNYDFRGLEKLENIQSKESEGVVYYDSYWWNEMEPKKAEKLSSFKWIKIGESKWVVATNSDLDERQGLTRENLIALLGLFIIIAIVCLLFYYLIKQYRTQYKNYIEYHELQKKQEDELIRHKVEKKMEQDSKLETLGVFSTTIVHDLNNILTPLIGLTSLLMEEYKTDEALYNDLESIYISAEKGKNLSNSILHFSSVKNKKNETINIVNEINEAIHIIQPIIPKSISINFKIEDDRLTKVTCLSETEDLQRILINLVTNSVQAIGKKGGIVDILVSLEEQELNQRLLIRIADDGPGIPKEIREEILYTPFFTTKGADGGTGVGLFVVTSLIKKNNWRIKLDTSTVGTSFTISIPINESI